MESETYTYREQCEGVLIQVHPFYTHERSNPENSFYFFGYRIHIENKRTVPVQLLTRHWIIRDGVGREEHVYGDGVIGQQPKLQPGESFEYTSFCPLTTPTGNMRGSYGMVDTEGKKFSVKIPVFFLRFPGTFH